LLISSKQKKFALEHDKGTLLLFIDNFDSFTYNLVQCFQILGIETRVVRGQSKTVQECLTEKPRFLVIGPGPGTPSNAILSKELMIACAGNIPILGVCLGHQALAEIYGGIVNRAKVPMHGKTSSIYHINEGIFQQIPQGFAATRYHSLIVDKSTLPACLEITARTDTDEIMGLRHRQFQIESVQFHPESVLTLEGPALLKNFLESSFKKEQSSS
jgi:anthranilate synthase/aminodeoxychorismate synthase-like glutamine amidotransferase